MCDSNNPLVSQLCTPEPLEVLIFCKLMFDRERDSKGRKFHHGEFFPARRNMVLVKS